jgi:hypothetical protein
MQLFDGRSSYKSGRGGCRLMGSRLPPRTTPDWALLRASFRHSWCDRRSSPELGFACAASGGQRPGQDGPSVLWRVSRRLHSCNPFLFAFNRHLTNYIEFARSKRAARSGLRCRIRRGGQDSQGSPRPSTTVGTGASLLTGTCAPLSERRGHHYTNIRSASLGADWSISAWGSWKTCSSQISRHHK